MMKLQWIVLSVVSGMLASSFALAQGSAEEGEAKATPCVACHGLNGNSVNPIWPSLAGQHPQYILKQLQAFKSGERQDPLMTPMAAPLSEDDMQDLAAYYAKQTPTGLEAEPGKVSLGQRLYRGGSEQLNVAACTACHGPGGSGNPMAVYPSIKGQHAAYVAAQLKAYRAGTRQTDQNQMMRTVANLLTDEQIEALASYVQGLR
jgi:cytochrome c553